MNELSVGLWLRRERERRGITLRHIADQTKVAVPLLEGLEAGDLSKWPGGIYRRAFVKSYAAALGLDPDAVVQRVEQEHPPEPTDSAAFGAAPVPVQATPHTPITAAPGRPAHHAGQHVRLLGTAADLTVAIVLGLGSAAAGSRLLWPVMFIALYYAVGVLLTGTSPMVALLSDAEPDVRRAGKPGKQAPQPEQDDAPDGVAGASEIARAAERQAPERRAARRISRAQRASQAPRPHVQ